MAPSSSTDVSKGMAKLSVAASSSTDVRPAVKYELADAGEGYTTATFIVPASAVDSLSSGPPIMCRGSQFVLERGASPNTVTTRFYSPMPKMTADAIAEKVHQRVLDPNPPGMEACNIS
jgi:hypothetical protein